MPARTVLKLGTRKSALALTQSQGIADLLMERHKGLTVELVHVVTTGDKTQDRSFGAVGAVGMFVKELEQAILDGRVDFGVHSMKDLPTDETPGLTIHAVPERANPYDVLISRDDEIIDELREGARVGTGSLRRQAQLLAYREDLEMSGLRGNIDTRLARLDAGRYDAIVLAAAGIERLGLQDRVTEIFTPDVMLPAVAQGCLAVQGRTDDAVTGKLLKALDDRPSHAAARAERAFLAALGGGCHAPIAALAHVEGSTLHLEGLVGSPDGLTILRDEARGPVARPEALGLKLGRTLLGRGAGELLESSTGPEE